jgi:regulator of replication initiation timing
MKGYIQRRVGLVLGLTALSASLVQLLASLHTFDLNLGETLLLPSVLFVFGTGVLFLITALVECKASKIIQVAVLFITGYGTCLGVSSGDLTYLIFFGLGFFLAMEYGFLDRHVVSKALIALGLLLAALTYGMIFLNKLSPLVIVHSLIGASAIISVSYLLFKVSLRRYRDQKKSLEEIIEDRTRKIQEELSRVSELKDDLEDQLEENRNLLSVNENLLREVLHRTKNNMQLISSFLNLESTQYDEPYLQAIFEKTVQRIGTLAISHELLYSKAKIFHFSI